MSKVTILTREESFDLLTMFHDYSIVDIVKADDFVQFFIDLPYSEQWQLDEYIIQLQVFDCKNIRFKPWPGTGDETTDVEKIAKMGLLIQAYKFHAPDRYELFCSGCGTPDGELEFTAADFKIFDKNGKEISLDVLKEWATEWWNGIEKMWEEQKRNSGNSSIT